MRYKVEVQTKGDPKYYSNGLRFDTTAEAEAYAVDLWSRWTAVTTWRIVPEEE